MFEKDLDRSLSSGVVHKGRLRSWKGVNWSNADRGGVKDPAVVRQLVLYGF